MHPDLKVSITYALAFRFSIVSCIWCGLCVPLSWIDAWNQGKALQRKGVDQSPLYRTDNHTGQLAHPQTVVSPLNKHVGYIHHVIRCCSPNALFSQFISYSPPWKSSLWCKCKCKPWKWKQSINKINTRYTSFVYILMCLCTYSSTQNICRVLEQVGSAKIQKNITYIHHNTRLKYTYKGCPQWQMNLCLTASTTIHNTRIAVWVVSYIALGHFLCISASSFSETCRW